MTGPRVAFLSHTATLSGAELFLLRMLQHRPHVDPVVVLFDDGPLRECLEEAGVVVHVLPLPAALRDLGAGGEGTRAAAGTLAALPGWLRDLARLLRAIEPGLVYTNSAKAHVLGGPVARRAGLPVLMHVHNGISPDTYGRANRTALHRAARRADAVLVNSEATRATLSPQEAERAALFYCPTEVPAAPPPLPPRGSTGLQLSLVGRIAEWKGQELGIEALARVRATVDPHAELHLYGDPLFARDLDYRARVEHRVADLALGGAVHWHGHVDDVPSALAQYDVLVHTSVTPEPLGQVVLEGLAAGRPVVAADSGGPLELVEHGVSGLLYRTGDADALAEAVAELTDPDLRGRLGRAGWERAQQFSYPVLLPRWSHLVQEAATGSARATGAQR